jgi:hypothetical protein
MFLMFMFFWRGQRVTASTVLANIFDGKYNLSGFGVQVNRLLNFVLQALYYGLTFGWFDAICVSSVIGGLGAGWISLNYIRKYIVMSFRQEQAKKEVATT